MSELKEIRELFNEWAKIKDPMKRIEKVVEYLRTKPLNTIDVPIFILNELKTLWKMHKDLI